VRRPSIAIHETSMTARHARAALALLALPLLLAAAAPPRPAGAARPAGSAAARKAVEAVAERYRTLRGYHLEGRGETRFTSTKDDNSSVNQVRFLVQRPGRLASEVTNPQMTSRLVSNGDSLWTAVPQLGQYTVQPLATVRRDTDSAAFVRQFDPAAAYAHVLDGVREVRPLGKDTVHTKAGVVTCERYALASEPPTHAGAGVTVHPRVLWVDPATRMVLLDSVRIDQQHPQLGAIRSVNVTRMIVARPDPAFAADAFAFRPDGGLQRVRRFMRRSPEHADIEGRPARDFTLHTLAGDQPVRLSDQKGKVVLLDFWATWCGPCRGWLPIVAKAQRDYAAKGLQVYAVNLREPDQKVRDYLAKQKIDVPVLMDRTGSVGADYRAASIPLTVVVGRDGRVARVMVGLHGEEDLKDVLHEVGID
jgi:thiol-disulfide isomerase/thioredoxin/outer membrane lipoprotein-sorting protein